MKKLNLKAMLADLVAVINRFYVVLIFVFSVAVLSFLEINNKSFELDFNYWGGVILAVFSSISIVLFREVTEKKWVGLLSFSALIFIAIYSVFFFNHKTEWEIMQFVALLISMVLFTFVVLFFKRNSDVSFWIFTEKIVREIISTVIYMSILFGGLSLAVYAVNVLFEVNVSEKVYANISVICYLIIAPVYFLSNIPPKTEFYAQKPDYGKFLKILGLYVFLPILGIYLVILYFYLFKIIIRWELPNGWVTTLVSVLALGGYVAKFLLLPVSEIKIVQFLNRWFSVLLFPLVILMSVGLARRIADYGISINRLYVLAFNVWLYGVSVYLFLTSSKHLRWLVISFVAVLFIISVGPWSVFTITKHSVEADLTRLMTESGLYVHNNLVNNKENRLQIADTLASQISDKTYYYIECYGINEWKQKFNCKQKITNGFDAVELLGVNESEAGNQSKYISANLSENRMYDIKGYNTVLMNLKKENNEKLIMKNTDYKIEYQNNTILINNLKTKSCISFDLKSTINQLYKNDNNPTAKNKILVKTAGNYLLLINNISVNCKSSVNYELVYLDFTLFVK